MVRRRCEADLPACVAALRAVHEADGYPVRWPADPARWLTPRGTRAAWVVPSRDGVAGHVACGEARFGPEVLAALSAEAGVPPRDLVAVSRLFVVPSARRTGIARDLLAAVTGLGRPVLDVAEQGIAAVSLYEGLGWRRVASERAAWLAADGRPALVHYYVSPA